MADLAAQAYQVLGSEPPPGHELLAIAALHRTPPQGWGGVLGGGAIGAASEASRGGAMPARPTKASDARAILKAQDALGLCKAMVWGVNQHNLLVFKAGGMRQRTPVKLVARIPVQAVTLEGHKKKSIAVTIRGVPVEVAGETAPMTELAEAIRSVIGGPPAG
ncbi:MAG: hypothetical protein U0Q07_11335 [Acidimicrobiales bacterium]